MGCRAEIRTRACLTASQCATNWATLHPKCVENFLQFPPFLGWLVRRNWCRFCCVSEFWVSEDLSPGTSPNTTHAQPKILHIFRKRVDAEYGSLVLFVHKRVSLHFLTDVRKVQDSLWKNEPWTLVTDMVTLIKDEVFLVCGYHDSDMRPGALIVVYTLIKTWQRSSQS